MKKNYVCPQIDIIYTKMEDALLAGSPNNTGRGGNNTPDDGRFLDSKSFDMGEEEDWQDLDISANDWNF